jgi:tetratricopeptide (TPR) repeat protein
VTWLIAWIAVAIRIRRIDGVAGLGMLWFIILLVPSAILVLLDLGEPMAEHRVYLASAGMFLAIGTMFGRAWPLFGSGAFRYGLLCKFLLATWLTVLGGMTVLRNEVWANPIRLWLSAVQQAPDIWVPHVALGEALQNVGSHGAALAEFRLAIGLRPSEPVPYMKLALCLAEMRRLDDAAQVFEQLERLMPGSVVARNGLGAVAMLQGRYEDARRHYRSALQAHPDDVASRQSLAMIAETIDHDPAEAARLCEEVAHLAPGTQGIDECISRNRARGGEPAPPPRRGRPSRAARRHREGARRNRRPDLDADPY